MVGHMHRRSEIAIIQCIKGYEFNEPGDEEPYKDIESLHEE